MAKKKESRKEIVWRTMRGARKRKPRKVRPNVEGVPKPEEPEVSEKVMEVDEPYTQPPPTSNRHTSDLTCVIVNHKTLDLTTKAVESFTTFYPAIPLILIDNNSQDRSTQYLSDFMETRDNTILIINNSNIGHGPALHQGVTMSHTDFVFVMDSDCKVQHRGFLELMLDAFDQDRHLYAIGQFLWTNVNGVVYRNQDSPLVHKQGIPTIHPHAMMIRKSLYPTLPPFAHSGAPAINMMRAAFRQRVRIKDFPIHLYLTHLGSGTRGMYGGQWNP